MSSREEILQNVRRAIHVQYEKPDLSELEKSATTYPDKIRKFTEVMRATGGETIVLQDGEDLNTTIRKLYPDLKRIASNLKEVTCATFDPDRVESTAELDGTELAIVKGQ